MDSAFLSISVFGQKLTVIAPTWFGWKPTNLVYQQRWDSAFKSTECRLLTDTHYSKTAGLTVVIQNSHFGKCDISSQTLSCNYGHRIPFIVAVIYNTNEKLFAFNKKHWLTLSITDKLSYFNANCKFMFMRFNFCYFKNSQIVQ